MLSVEKNKDDKFTEIPKEFSKYIKKQDINAQGIANNNGGNNNKASIAREDMLFIMVAFMLVSS